MLWRRKRQVTIGHQSCRVFATYSLPGVLADLPTMGVCIRPSRCCLCPSTLRLLGLFHIPWTSASTLSLSTSFLFFSQQHTYATDIPLSTSQASPAPLRSLPSAKAQRTRAWLFAGSADRWPLHHNGVQPTRLPGTLHDTRVTLSTHTIQALPCGQQFPVFTGCDGSLCTHRNTYIGPCKWLYQELFPRTWAWLYLRAKAGCSAL